MRLALLLAVNTGVWTRAVVVWVVIVAAETVHGTVRQLFVAPLVGDVAARQAAVFTGALLVGLIALVFSRWLGDLSRGLALRIGLVWVTLMVAFEVGLGRALGYSWPRIAADYDLRRGGLMPIGLVVLLLAPLCAARLRDRRTSAGVTFEPLVGRQE